MARTISHEDKYRFYERAVQGPDFDLDFIDERFRHYFGRSAQVLREDFSGTGALSVGWVKRREDNVSYALDIDSVPQQYGIDNHYSRLSEQEKKRMHYCERDVLTAQDVKADIILATNFSYFFFKERKQLLQYFKTVRESLKKEGYFMLDIFGGSQCHEPIEDKNDCGEFYYYWDLEKMNPITNECLYKIHFRPKNNKQKYRDVFVYDWRMWSIREVKELLEEANFKHVDIYWEGDDGEGGGNGEFVVTHDVENCQSWVAYIVARA